MEAMLAELGLDLDETEEGGEASQPPAPALPPPSPAAFRVEDLGFDLDLSADPDAHSQPMDHKDLPDGLSGDSQDSDLSQDPVLDTVPDDPSSQDSNDPASQEQLAVQTQKDPAPKAQKKPEPKNKKTDASTAQKKPKAKAKSAEEEEQDVESMVGLEDDQAGSQEDGSGEDGRGEGEGDQEGMETWEEDSDGGPGDMAAQLAEEEAEWREVERAVEENQRKSDFLIRSLAAEKEKAEAAAEEEEDWGPSLVAEMSEAAAQLGQTMRALEHEQKWYAKLNAAEPQRAEARRQRIDKLLAATQALEDKAQGFSPANLAAIKQEWARMAEARRLLHQVQQRNEEEWAQGLQALRARLESVRIRDRQNEEQKVKGVVLRREWDEKVAELQLLRSDSATMDRNVAEMRQGLANAKQRLKDAKQQGRQKLATLERNTTNPAMIQATKDAVTQEEDAKKSAAAAQERWDHLALSCTLCSDLEEEASRLASHIQAINERIATIKAEKEAKARADLRRSLHLQATLGHQKSRLRALEEQLVDLDAQEQTVLDGARAANRQPLLDHVVAEDVPKTEPADCLDEGALQTEVEEEAKRLKEAEEARRQLKKLKEREARKAEREAERERAKEAKEAKKEKRRLAQEFKRQEEAAAAEKAAADKAAAEEEERLRAEEAEAREEEERLAEERRRVQEELESKRRAAEEEDLRRAHEAEEEKRQLAEERRAMNEEMAAKRQAAEEQQRLRAAEAEWDKRRLTEERERLEEELAAKRRAAEEAERVRAEELKEAKRLLAEERQQMEDELEAKRVAAEEEERLRAEEARKERRRVAEQRRRVEQELEDQRLAAEEERQAAETKARTEQRRLQHQREREEKLREEKEEKARLADQELREAQARRRAEEDKARRQKEQQAKAQREKEQMERDMARLDEKVKAREEKAKAKARKEKEAKARKEKDAEAEKEAKTKRDKEAKVQAEKESKAKRDKEAKAQAEKEAKEEAAQLLEAKFRGESRKRLSGKRARVESEDEESQDEIPPPLAVDTDFTGAAAQPAAADDNDESVSLVSTFAAKWPQSMRPQQPPQTPKLAVLHRDPEVDSPIVMPGRITTSTPIVERPEPPLFSADPSPILTPGQHKILKHSGGSSQSKHRVSFAMGAKAAEPSPPTSQGPISKAPTSKTPASKTPVSKTPASKTPVSKTPASKTPVSKTPVIQIPASKTTASLAPSSQRPRTLHSQKRLEKVEKDVYSFQSSEAESDSDWDRGPKLPAFAQPSAPKRKAASSKAPGHSLASQKPKAPAKASAKAPPKSQPKSQPRRSSPGPLAAKTPKAPASQCQAGEPETPPLKVRTPTVTYGSTARPGPGPAVGQAKGPRLPIWKQKAPSVDNSMDDISFSNSPHLFTPKSQRM